MQNASRAQICHGRIFSRAQKLINTLAAVLQSPVKARILRQKHFMRKRLLYIFVLLLELAQSGCLFFDSEGGLIYQQGKYEIRKKKLLSYYNASPDLIVSTGKTTVKINLNAFSKRQIPQEKIDHVQLIQVNADSLQIIFSSNDTTRRFTKESISLNVTRAVDSILQMK